MVSSVKLSCFLVVCLCSLYSANGQVYLPGSCPDVPVVPDFDIPAYMGLWYEVAKYPALFETTGKCITANYKLTENGTVDVVNTLSSPLAQGPIVIQGTAKAVDNGKLIVQFPGTPPTTESNYWVLDTDYTSYSVVFSCKPSKFTNSQIIWILTRSRVPSIDTFLKAVRAITNNGLSLNYLSVTNQEGCGCTC